MTATYPDGRVWRRTYQQIGPAKERRDRLLQITGVIVTIDRSDAVTWPNDVAS